MSVRSLIGFGATASAVGLLVLSALPYFGSYWWVFELPAHFKLHIGVASVGLACIALFWRSWGVVVLAAAAAVISWIVILSTPQMQDMDHSGVVVVSQNLAYSNDHVEQALGVLLEQDADLLVLQEYTQEWHESLAPLAAKYQYTIAVPQEGAFGIAVYSNVPVTSHNTHQFGIAQSPFIEVGLDAANIRVTLIAVHFQPPMSREWAADRSRQLVELQRVLNDIGEPFVVVGDFNNTPYSPVLRSFMTATGTGVADVVSLASWPAALGDFGIPIDLAVGSQDIRVGSVSAIDPVGSDHRGLRFSISTK